VAVQTKLETQEQYSDNGLSHASRQSRKHLNNVALRAYTAQQKAVQVHIDDERIAELLPMVHKIARQVVTYLKPPLSFEDMVSAGAVGLVRAARDFDPSHQAEFKTYAYIRIKGAILDELRGWSFMPENLRKRISMAHQLSQKISEQTGTAPKDTELAEKLGISLDELYETFENARAQHFISLDGFGEDEPVLSNLLTAKHHTAPEEKIEREELIDKLAEAIEQLSEKQQQVVMLYYQHQLTMKQIADILEITESRVSQLHASALFNLSVKLRQWKDGRI
jgi:RNA polymerase sigma factor for flagellar operon FliA